MQIKKLRGVLCKIGEMRCLPWPMVAGHEKERERCIKWGGLVRMCGDGILEENGNLENGIFVVVKEGKENREKEKEKNW